MAAAARLRCKLLEDDEKRVYTKERKKNDAKKSTEERSEKHWLNVQRQGESRLPSLPILEGSFEHEGATASKEPSAQSLKERRRNKLPGVRGQDSRSNVEKKNSNKIKGGSGREREAFTVWCTAGAHCAASAATWDGTSPNRRAAWH